MKTITAYLVIASGLATLGVAQDKPAAMFRLHIRMQESGGRSQETTRNYVLVLHSESSGKINASRRVPFYTSTKGEVKELHTAALGSIIECDARDAEGGVRLDCSFESSYVETEQPTKPIPIGFLPVVNSRQVHTAVVVPLGPEVEIAQLDDPSSGNRLEIFVAVERFAGPIPAENAERR